MSLDKLNAIAELNQHRLTLMAEIRDVYRLTQNAIGRLAEIEKLVSSDRSGAIGQLWQSVLVGREGESELSAADIAAVVEAGVRLCNVVEDMQTKRPVFDVVTRQVERMSDGE